MSRRRDEGKKEGGKEGRGTGRKRRREGREENRRKEEEMKGETGRRGEWVSALVPRGPRLPHPAALTRLPSPLLPVWHQQRSSVASGSHKIFTVLLPALLHLSLPRRCQKAVELSEVKHVCHQAWWVGCCSRLVHRKMLICPRLGCRGGLRPDCVFPEAPEEGAKAMRKVPRAGEFL